MAHFLSVSNQTHVRSIRTPQLRALLCTRQYARYTKCQLHAAAHASLMQLGMHRDSNR